MRQSGTLTIIAAAICLSCMGVSLAAETPAAVKQTTDIPAQPLAPALQRLTRERDIQLVYRHELVRDLKTPGASGKLTTLEALSQLLSGTGLTYRFLDENTITIVPLASAASSSSESAATIVTKTGVTENSVVQLAQAGPHSAPAPVENNSNTPADGTSEILVTGTHIRGSNPVGQKVTVITREDIENSGYASVQDVMKNITQTAGSGRAEVQGGAGNFTRGTAFNLRGLGAGATLTLVNGRRRSASGDNGDYVDIDSIPVAAIERIEILSDGASALYGSDAIGGVVNIILRRNYDGFETRVRYAAADGSDEIAVAPVFGRGWGSGDVLLGYQYYHRDALATYERAYALNDKRAFGGRDFSSTTVSNPGNILNVPGFAIPTGQNGTALTPTSYLSGQRNLQDRTEGTTLLPENETQSAFFTVRQDLSDALELSFDGLFSRRESTFQTASQTTTLTVPTSNAFYVAPTGVTGPLRIAYDFINDLGPREFSGATRTWSSTLAGTYRFASSWRLVGSASYAKENYHTAIYNGVNDVALNAALSDGNRATAFNPFADGSNTNPATLNAIRVTQLNAGSSDVRQGTLVADGTLFSLSGGAVRMALGADHRTEELNSSAALDHPYDRTAWAIFGEVTVPFVSSVNAHAGLEALELSIAGRRDDYDDFGTTTNPRIGLRYMPLEAVTLRGTWGKSFRAPRLIDLDDQFANPLTASVRPLSDPRAPSPPGTSVVLALSGGNPLLNAETATTWTAGLDLAPVFLPGFTLSGTYYDVKYRDQITTPIAGTVLPQESVWSSIITRNPTPAQIAAACALSLQQGNGNCAATPPSVLIDLRLHNVAQVQQRGIDAQVRQEIPASFGELALSINGTYILSNKQQGNPGLPAAETSNTVLNSARVRLHAAASWSRAAWSVNFGVNHTGSMQDNLNVPNVSIDSWTTVDAGVAYRFSGRPLWNGLSAALRASNLFNDDPPFVNIANGFDPANASSLGRLVSVQLSKEW